MAAARNYRAYPTGMPGEQSAAAVALLGDRLIIFEDSLAGQPSATLHAVNATGYTMRLEDQTLVVTRTRGRQWCFETVNDGASWRLTRLGDVRHPGRWTTLTYTDNGKVTAIHLPNKAQIDFTLNQAGLPTALDAPFGEHVEIERDSDGWITSFQRQTEQS